MKQYQAPEILVTKFQMMDVLTASIFDWTTGDDGMDTEDPWADENSGSEDVGGLWGDIFP